MLKPKVFVTRIIPEEGLNRINNVADAEIWGDELPPSYEVLLNKVKGVNGLVCLLTDKIDGQLMDHAGESLKVISQMAVGFDNVDVAAATAREIPVGNTPGVLTDTTADFAFTLLVAAARRVVEGDHFVKANKWKTWGPTLLMGYDIHRATLGIVGMGRIGRAVAKRASGFDMRIIYADPNIDEKTEREFGAERLSFDEVLSEADFVSLHIPLTPETHHMISERELKIMKPSCVLVNTSRGPTVDPHALYDALKEQVIAYAALDVTEPEPISIDDPLLTLDNCLIVPHIASSSFATRNKMATMAAANLEAGLAGEKLPNCVNSEVYK
jgi:glyoxylate reductase